MTSAGRLSATISTSAAKKSGYVSVLDADGEFRAMQAEYNLERGVIRLTKQAMEALEAEPGMIAGVTPSEAIDGPRDHKPTKTEKPAKNSKKKVTA